jgi:ribonucleoside-triphosphate reductase
MDEKFPGAIPSEFWHEAEWAIIDHEVMPSMRALMTAGPALDRSHVAGYNCSFMPIDSPRAFDEALYILMNGTGLGFSAESKYTSKLPIVNEHFERSETIIKVADSKEGWARGLRELIAMLYAGQIPAIDVTAVRPAGARLKTFGGRSSGPQPLVNLFDFTIELFKRAAGRQLTPLEAHDLVCKIAEVVVVGGVRRSALISLGDLERPRNVQGKVRAVVGVQPQRALANNSAAYYAKPGVGEFLKEWTSLYESKSGERGIVNMENMQRAAYAPRRDGSKLAGTNPCGEISLRPYQFCNLTEIIIEEGDDLASLTRKARIATVLGTIQSSFTNFKYLRKIWKQNCEEERLLGVSLTGQFGNQLMSGSLGLDVLADTLDAIREETINVNAEIADAMGINRSTQLRPSSRPARFLSLPGQVLGNAPVAQPALHSFRTSGQQRPADLFHARRRGSVRGRRDEARRHHCFLLPAEGPGGCDLPS